MTVGRSGDKTLHQIDASTATGQLIGVSDTFEIVEIDPTSGADGTRSGDPDR